ncbi:MAG: DUF72 domain-containing protein [Promethearchaeota archaeon]|nr:MAG: DUF72 domain-containing protein [Candidatus Lokiarchaeota archaeon]
MVKLTIGTAGWDYKDWIGPFYPKKLKKSQHLEYFSKFFSLVEINSTFYNLPSEDMVINWNNRVPENFRFIVKVWQKITHNLEDPDLDSYILEFFSRLKLLGPKIARFLLQFPPWFKYSENHLQKLKSLLNQIPSVYKYIIELRDNSWYNPEILSKFIDGENLILGTTYMPGVIPFYMLNQNFYYIRLIGDRELTVFNQIQRDQKDALNDLYKNAQNLMNRPNIYEIFIIVNNHFQGFAPESVNKLKKMVGLPFRALNTQKNLIEYI